MQEIANRDESLRIPFIPFKDPPLYVDYGSFVADQGKLVIVLQTKVDFGYYETVFFEYFAKFCDETLR